MLPIVRGFDFELEAARAIQAKGKGGLVDQL
jgi:hypothetical protein